MCGIAGYIGLEAAHGKDALGRMATALAHRGPDGEGFWVCDAWGFAHRRLAVLDRAGSAQPMASADGRHVLVYNGEVYNYRELRAELMSLGVTFGTAGDTEVVLAAWRQWGPAAFDRFDGMFALAIGDTVTGEVVLARDQFGIKPLYLAADSGGAVVFASEIAALFATRVVRPRPDDVTIYRYLQFRVHDDTERTFFAGIVRLLPGEMAVVSPDGEVRRSTYTSLFSDLRALASAPRPYDERAREEFGAELVKSVRRRLCSEVPVGTALSGGLDSSTIVTTINGLLDHADREAAAIGARQQTFSAVFPGQRNDEERYIDAVAERCTALTVHKIRPTVDGFLADLDDFVAAQGEPVISTGPYAQYCVMREAGGHVTVMVDGQGADEMLAGYVPYVLVYLRQLRRQRRPLRAAMELAAVSDMLWRLGRERLGDTLFRRSGLATVALLEPGFASAHAGERLDVVSDDLKLRLEDDLFRHSMPALLRYEDRNSMRFSVEGRVPFVSADLLRTLWSFGDEAIHSGGWNKRVLRDATRDLLPAAVNRRRDKIGFTTPEDEWFRRMGDELREVFASDSFGGRPYFDQAAVLHAFDRYRAGEVNTETMTFWRIANVELWLRRFVDEPAGR
ncbi:MAG TPA: asparagine synthase (glutamine-hydrolyzing) [Mycobacteriales bacterium]|jgi:asparagine synthase (glutamine-hydrolysing)